MRGPFTALVTAWALAFSVTGEAACPVGKKEGDTWCEKGMEWKCERCGSEYCPIITGRRCVKDDDSPEAAVPAFRAFIADDRQGTELIRPKGGIERKERPSHGL